MQEEEGDEHHRSAVLAAPAAPAGPASCAANKRAVQDSCADTIAFKRVRSGGASGTILAEASVPDPAGKQGPQRVVGDASTGAPGVQVQHRRASGRERALSARGRDAADAAAAKAAQAAATAKAAQAAATVKAAQAAATVKAAQAAATVKAAQAAAAVKAAQAAAAQAAPQGATGAALAVSRAPAGIEVPLQETGFQNQARDARAFPFRCRGTEETPPSSILPPPSVTPWCNADRTSSRCAGSS
jgi:hypothetical protein